MNSRAVSGGAPASKPDHRDVSQTRSGSSKPRIRDVSRDVAQTGHGEPHGGSAPDELTGHRVVQLARDSSQGASIGGSRRPGPALASLA